MTSKKKLAKGALENPKLFSPGELVFFKRWLEERKHQKELKKKLKEKIDGDS